MYKIGKIISNKEVIIILAILLGISAIEFGVPLIAIGMLLLATIYFSILNDFKSLIYMLILMFTQNIMLIIFSHKLNAVDTKLIISIKEIMVYLSVAITIIIKRKFRFYKIDIAMILYGVLIISSFFISNVNLTAKVVSVRELLLPIICFLYGRQIKLSDDDLEMIYKIIIYLGIFVAIFGILEMTFLGDAFWKKAGIQAYSKNKGFESWSVNGIMSSYYSYDFWSLTSRGIRRLISIFVEVLASAHFLLLAFIVTYYKFKDYKFKEKFNMKLIIEILLFIAICLTLSKGAVLVLGVFVLTTAYFKYNKKKLTTTLVIFSLVAMVLIISNNYGKSNAIGYHLRGLVDNIKDLKIFGHGMGKSGNFAKMFGDKGSKVKAGESFVGVILGQIGLSGFVLYVIYNIKLIIDFFKKALISNNGIIALTLILSVFAESFLSESAISFLGTGLYFIIAGIEYNKVKTQEIEKA